MKKIKFLINYALNTKKALDIALDRYTKGKKEYIVFGTTHERMFKNKIYNIQVVKNLIDNIKPDLVIFEASKDVYKKNNLIDGRIDMQYIYSYCLEKEIIYTMMDSINLDGSIYPNETNMIRDKQMFANMKTEKYETSGLEKVLVFTGIYHKISFDEIFKDHGYKIDKNFNKNIMYENKSEVKYNKYLFNSLNKKIKYIDNVIDKKINNIENIKCKDAWIKYFLNEKQYIQNFVEKNKK